MKFLFLMFIVSSSLFANDIHYYYDETKIPIVGSCEKNQDGYFNLIINIEGHSYVIEKFSHNEECHLCKGYIY